MSLRAPVLSCLVTGIGILLLAVVSTPAAATVYVGATFDKDIKGLPDTSTTLTPKTMVQLADWSGSGETDYQAAYIDLSSAVRSRRFVVDASDVLSYTNPDTYDVVVSFADTEIVVGGAGSISDEDLVRITSNDGIVTSSLFFDFNESDLRSNIDLNAFDILSDNEILVSFDKDVKDYFGPGLDMTKDDITKFTISGTSTILDSETFIDFDFGSSANLDAFTITDDGSVLGSFAQTINDPQDGAVQDHDIWRFSTAGTAASGTISVTDIGVSLFMDNTGVDTNVNLASLFSIGVPEPGRNVLFGIGLALVVLSRRRIAGRA